jgi:Protein of unknown function (DUF2510)
MFAETIKIVPGAGLIATVGLFVVAAIIQAATKNKDAAVSQVALSTIRRCTSCNQIVGQSATECRHCLAALPSPASVGQWSSDPFKRPNGFATDWVMKGPGGLVRILDFTVTCVDAGRVYKNVTMAIGNFKFMGGGVGAKAVLNGGTWVRTFRQHAVSNLALQQPTSAVGWHADPHGTHELRYWDGIVWSEHVSDHGEQSVDHVAVGEPSE